MAHKTQRSDTFTSPTIRGAYFFVHEKRSKDSKGALIPPEKQQYEFVGIVPKLNRDPSQCANYMLFANAAMSALGKVSEWGGQLPPGGNWPIKDGDDPVKVAKYPWQAGAWIIKFTSNFPPKVAILQNGSPVEIPARRIGATDAYKGGDYIVTSTNAFTYDNNSKGVKFNFEGVLFVAAGEAIGAQARSVDQMFGGVAAPVQPGPAPTYAPNPPGTPPGAVPVAPVYAPPAPPIAPAMPAAPVYAPPVGAGGPPMPPPLPGAGAPGLPPFPGR
jgi:hypothetical protein